MREGSNQYDDEEQGGATSFSLARVISAMRRHFRTIFAIVFTTGLVTGSLLLMLPNSYDASAIVQIDPRKKTISDLEGVISELNADAATIESEAEIIRSRAILLKVIDLLKLRGDPEFAEGKSLLAVATELLGWSTPSNRQTALADADADPTAGRTNTDALESIKGPQSPGASLPQRDAIAASIYDRLTVRRVRTTLLIEIRFTSSDPVKAARIANTIAEVYLAEQLAAKKRAAGYATEVLETKLGEMRAKLATAERAVESYKSQSGIFASEGQVLSEKQLARLMEQTIIARNNTAEARAKFQQAKSLREQGLDETTIADVLDSHTVRLMKEKLADASRKRAELASKYGRLHPALREAEAEVADARSKVEAEVRSVLAQLENAYQQAAAREQQLLGDLEERKAQEAEAKDKTVGLKDLEREAETTKQLFEALLTRYKQTAETADLQLPDARLVEQADTPLRPSSPKRKQIFAVSIATSLMLAIGLALFLEFGTTGIGMPEDAEAVLDLAHLSSLPLLADAGTQEFDEMRNVRLMIAEPIGPYAEAVRDVRRELDVRHQQTAADMVRNGIQPGRIVLVAASLPGEGSSVLASNLAHHYALTGKRTLLIDADMRHANLSRELLPVRPRGLLDALRGDTGIEQTIYRDALTELCFLPATANGPGTLNNPELLSTPVLARTLHGLREQFDVIILDAPPLLPVMDTRILADHADQILFVMAWRNTPKTLAKRALKSLSFNSDKIAGVVINKVDPAVLAASQGYAGETAPKMLRQPSLAA